MTLTLRRDTDFEFYVLPPLLALSSGAFFRKTAAEIPPFVSPVMNWVVRETSFPEQGVTAGFLDVDVSFLGPELLSGASQQVGLVCLQSHRDMGTTVGGHRGYGFHYDAINGAIRLRKYTGGLRVSTTLLLISSLHPFTSTPQARRLGLTWIVDPQLQWTLLIVYFGTLSMPGSFIEVGRYQDFDAPYTDGIAEGGFYDDGGSAQPYYFGFTRAVLYGQRYGVLVEPSLAQYRSATPQIS